MKIVYLKYSEIDKVKWDKCISQAFNGILYAYSWYLDIVCDEWDALIQGDYYRIMPLPYRMKYGIRYLYQPFFTQQLGVFSTLKLNSEITKEFIKNIPKKFQYIDLNLNIHNKIDSNFLEVSSLPTYQLDLIADYETLYSKYSVNTRRNIKKAIQQSVSLAKGVSANEFINLFRTSLGEKIKELKDRDYDVIRRIISLSIYHKFGKMYAAYTKQNELCSAALFVSSHNKTIYLLAASTPEGIENKAMFLIIDSYIKENAENYLTLDFEGSKIPGLARFYGGFGAIECEYYNIKQNKLPRLLKLFKK